jgi:hypothetical protein
LEAGRPEKLIGKVESLKCLKLKVEEAGKPEKEARSSELTG